MSDQAFHPIRRARKHYGIDADVDMIRDWEARVRAGDAVFLRRSTATAAIYRLVHDGTPIRVVFGMWIDQPGRIITVLPPKDAARVRIKSEAERKRSAQRQYKRERKFS